MIAPLKNDPIRRLVYGCYNFARAKKLGQKETTAATLKHIYDHAHTLTINEVRLLDAIVDEHKIDIDEWFEKVFD